MRELDIEIIRTTQVKAFNFSSELIQLKQAKESLKWEYLKIVIIDNILYFLWQDNNWVLNIITVYNLTDIIIWFCKRFSSTNTSVSITWFVFRNLLLKDLSISIIINAYNHYMSDVDTAN